ncbi:hypothetical protein [Priestia megaterium]|uniref:hypothetical protein n=1 Tax=Priestia megaterium TaxID=1404 RepID=UPI0011298ED7|nr:hypothetical protein [Priestia megaterium]TPF17998.1 hypothetical protein CBE78_01870 [Priestia megaterium]TPF22105.1 hypothetical protein CBE79_04375 [Priestia megaterium]
MNKEFWILAPKNMKEDEVLKDVVKNIDKLMKFHTEDEANEYRKYGDLCEEDDAVKKVTLTFAIS